jgi:type I restriction enzyme S subunit
MVPEGWKKTRLKDITRVITSGSRDWAQYYSEKGSKFIRMTNLQRGNINLNLKDVKYINLSGGTDDGRRTALQRDDILMSITAELGKVGVVPENLGEAFINQHTALIRVQDKIADSIFLALMLSSSSMNRTINRLNDAGAKAGLNLQTIRNLTVSLPPLPEQKKIARILSTWDKAIETVDKLIENSKQQKKALMQQLLTGKKRLPGFSGEWKEVRLNELFKPVTRKNTKNISLVLTVSGENGLVDQTTYFNRKVAADCLDGYYHLKNGEFAYNRSAMKGYPFGAIKRLEQHEDGVLSTLYMCFKLKSTTNSGDFYRHYFEHGLANKELYKVVQVGARAHGLLNISKGDFFDIKILCPPEDEQKAIADALNAMDTLLNKEKRQRKALLCQKQALMQQLLTGKRRVTIEE